MKSVTLAAILSLLPYTQGFAQALHFEVEAQVDVGNTFYSYQSVPFSRYQIPVEVAQVYTLRIAHHIPENLKARIVHRDVPEMQSCSDWSCETIPAHTEHSAVFEDAQLYTEWTLTSKNGVAFGSRREPIRISYLRYSLDDLSGQPNIDFYKSSEHLRFDLGRTTAGAPILMLFQKMYTTGARFFETANYDVTRENDDVLVMRKIQLKKQKNFWQTGPVLDINRESLGHYISLGAPQSEYPDLEFAPVYQ